MAINRYTRPTQAQYIPMDMSTYAKLGEAGIAANQKPWNIISAIQARREKQYGEAVGMQSQIEEGIGGIKGINPHDQQLVNSRKEHYYKLLNDAIKKTGGNPAAMLPALTSINRSFRLDAISGPLSEVNQRYSVGMEDLKQAKKDVSSGKLSPEGYRLQAQLLGTGVMVPRTGDIDSSAKKMITGDFKNSRFKSDKDAYSNFQQNMINKYRDIYYRLSDKGKVDMLNQFHSAFNQYYKNSDIDAVQRERETDYWNPSVKRPSTVDNRSIEGISNVVKWDDNGEPYVKDKDPSGLKFKTNPFGEIGQDILNRWNGIPTDKEAKAQVDKAIKNYDVPEKDANGRKYSTKERYYIAKSRYEKASTRAYTEFELKDSKKYGEFGLLTQDGRVRSFENTNIKMTIGDKTEKIAGNELYKTLKSKLKLDKNQLMAYLKKSDTKGRVSFDGDGTANIDYVIPNENGEDVRISIPIEDEKVAAYAKPLGTINHSIQAGDINVTKSLNGRVAIGLPSGYTKYKIGDKTVNSEDYPPTADGFKIKYISGKNKYVILAYKYYNGKYEQMYAEGKNGEKKVISINTNSLLSNSLRRMRDSQYVGKK